ncbi:MAG: hypothetical protein COT84_01685 [Chlamydiae bacterium CG10_big_fil_rev_8_21_14_0_10_35_9]|nr:MAG: hypothetical protein COT84_01685 [Chlamydiae bacterium CG10_big_fil_rev_8_21_14_0_10_35_9]
MSTIEILTFKPDNFTSKLEVASCYILHKEKFLMLKRSPKSSFGNSWCLPGGKIDREETPLQGILREIKEEIGMSLDPKKLEVCNKLFVKRPDVEYVFHLYFYKSDIFSEVILNEEHTKSLWVTHTQALTMPLILGGERIIDCYKKYLEDKHLL